MASEEILRLARSGDPTVLTSLLNHVLKPYGVTATVVRHEIRLEIQLVASRPVEEPTVTQLVLQVIRQLNIPYIPTVAIAPAPASPQHSSPETMLSQDAQRNWTQPATHNSVAWRQDEDGISVSESIANPESIAEFTTEFTADVPPQPAALSPVPSPMSAIQTPDSQGHPDSSTDSVNLDESLNIFPPPGEPLFEEGVEVDLGASPAASPVAVPSAVPPDEENQSNLWQRPEAVIFVAYLIAVIIWQLYIDLTTDPANQKSGWTATALARRLGTSRTTLSRRKYQEDFSAWTQSLDPDGLAWMYVGPHFSPVLGVDVLPAAPR
ncbi:helix-turn-helix domain-containing protein [Leptolyngbya sp. O-77]|uniref:helix-turn-helix domain-containing protein n=1 Tax=Leptolyngbya sp. O-77 TaxID=1080068 RepID=UPI00074D3F56|nr:helix-turn-helix domain-containing protein [Leptolyngbya sp. O-77]BAU40936.1 hypothetical protein O77CONTIG1_00743 [Leptolyngbya sp. O-77]